MCRLTFPNWWLCQLALMAKLLKFSLISHKWASSHTRAAISIRQPPFLAGDCSEISRLLKVSEEVKRYKHRSICWINDPFFFLRDWLLLNLNDSPDYLFIHRFWDVPAYRLKFLTEITDVDVGDLKVIIWFLLSVCYSQWQNTCIRGSKLNWSKLGSFLLKLRSFSKNSSLPDYTPWIFLQSVLSPFNN